MYDGKLGQWLDLQRKHKRGWKGSEPMPTEREQQLQQLVDQGKLCLRLDLYIVVAVFIIFIAFHVFASMPNIINSAGTFKEIFTFFLTHVNLR